MLTHGVGTLAVIRVSGSDKNNSRRDVDEKILAAIVLFGQYFIRLCVIHEFSVYLHMNSTTFPELCGDFGSFKSQNLIVL